MITATEVKLMTEVVIAQEKEKRINAVLEWCEACEERIIEKALKGVWKTHLQPPTSDYLLPYDERNEIIRTFFEHYKYKVDFKSGYVGISWYIK